MTQGLFTTEEVSAMILAGHNLLLAGDDTLLSQLPAGNWIGGSTPYFILYPDNRTTSFEKIFVTQLPEYVTKAEIMEYDETTIKNIFNDGPDNGFTVLILPYSSPVLIDFTLNATHYENFATNPVCGWVSGQPLDIIYTKKSYTASGIAPSLSSEKAVAMHVSLPCTKYAEIHIFNPYIQGDGDDIQFDNDTIVISDAIINGEKRNFADYLREIGNEKQMPLTGNYSGTMINCAIGPFDGKEVPMAAPVFKYIDYKMGKIDDTIAGPELINDKIVFSVTCFYNFIQPDLCSKYLKKMNGPVVFGEIAYQLVNQTTVYVTVDDVVSYKI